MSYYEIVLNTIKCEQRTDPSDSIVRFEVLHILFTICQLQSYYLIKQCVYDINYKCVSRENVYHLLTLKCLNIMFSERKCLSDNCQERVKVSFSSFHFAFVMNL